MIVLGLDAPTRRAGVFARKSDRSSALVPAGYDPRVSIWNDFGFRESPYLTEPVPPNEEGAYLFVGRVAELRQLKLRLTSAATHPTIEGANGVGKTSLVSVAGYHARKDFEDGNTGQLLIPLQQPFQMTAGETVEAFVRRLYFALAQGFIDNHELMKRAGMSVPDVGEVKRWLSAPIFTQREGGFQVLSTGPTYGQGSQPNTSSGFEEAGFQTAIDGWLRDCFPSRQSGGFICVLDNLELLQTHQAARDLLEALRDSAFNKPGLRWVLCGARGIMRSAASSSRLQGVLADPMELLPLPDEFVADVIARRIETFRIDESAYAPVEPDGFHHLYEVGNRNLRNALKYCEDYALWVGIEVDGTDWPGTTDDKRQTLEIWMAETAEKYLDATPGVGARAWEVFEGIVERGGSISPSDFADFGFETSQAMRGQMRALEDATLVESSVDETDKRRRLIEITARGWIVNYQRSGYKTPRQLTVAAQAAAAADDTAGGAPASTQ
jgi:hypothetical protein